MPGGSWAACTMLGVPRYMLSEIITLSIDRSIIGHFFQHINPLLLISDYLIQTL